MPWMNHKVYSATPKIGENQKYGGDCLHGERSGQKIMNTFATGACDFDPFGKQIEGPGDREIKPRNGFEHSLRTLAKQEVLLIFERKTAGCERR
jgi:hypothetical protein